MGIGDAIMVTSCLAGLMLALPAMLVFMNLALLSVSDRATHRLSRGGITPFFAGLGIILLIGVPSSMLMAAGSIFQLFGSLSMLCLLFWGFMGLAVVARLVGQRLTALYEREESPLSQTVAGSLVLSFSVAFPLIGWIIIFPFSLLIGLGAVMGVVIGGLWRRFFGSESPTLASVRS